MSVVSLADLAFSRLAKALGSKVLGANALTMANVFLLFLRQVNAEEGTSVLISIPVMAKA